MFGFGVGEAATIAAVLQGLKALNDGLATVKEAGANAGQISSLVSRYSDLDQKIRDVEAKKAGVLSVKDSMNLQVAKQQAANFHQALKDSLLMQQGGAAQDAPVCRSLRGGTRDPRRDMLLLQRTGRLAEDAPRCR